MSRLVIVSNRLPVTIGQKEGELFFFPSAGGLATGLNSLDENIDKIWLGWPGEFYSDLQSQIKVRNQLEKDGLMPVFLEREEIDKYYLGFSNKTIWPHFHYFTQYTCYDESTWEVYQKVNRKFADELERHLKPDDVVWVQDYQLMLLPGYIRERFPKQSIGFFLHIPFPSYEIFRILPWRKQILKGLLGADQIGFHTYGYMRHFLSAVYRIVGIEHDFGQLSMNSRSINVDVFPMGIDYNKYAYPELQLGENQIQTKIDAFRAKGRELIISIDRLDYTKGIPQRLRAYKSFLEQYPEYHDKLTLMLIVVPSRSQVDQYQDLKNEVDTLVGQIDGQFRTFRWSPIQYFYRSFSFEDLSALYKAAKIAMITPLRDGMNLVAKEFVASKSESKEGVLILSEMAGAANELSDALLINPLDTQDMVDAIITALTMSSEEQADRLTKMQKRLKDYDVKKWARTFLNQLDKIHLQQSDRSTNFLEGNTRDNLIEAYQKANSRLLFLDYDGTLVDFHGDPQKASPDNILYNILQELQADPKNKIIIISGRDKDTLETFVGKFGFEMAAEHGVWIKIDGRWQVDKGLAFSWKDKVLPTLADMVARTPGSFIEEKDYSLAWHYRLIDRALGEKRIREFRSVLQYLTANLDLQVLEGNKVVEIKNSGVNKGKAALQWRNQKSWDFVLALGDDHTDEDTFRALKTNDYTIKVGKGQTTAKFNLPSVKEVRKLLHDLTKAAPST